jgi:cytochrome c553
MQSKYMRYIIFLTLFLVVVSTLFFYFNSCTHDTKLTDDEITTISLKEANISTLAHGDAASIYHHRCQPCHGKYAQLHALSKSAVINSWSTTQIEEALLAYKLKKRNSKGLGNLMHAQSMNLSNDEIKALAHYISTL